ncbi:MAG: hypothetical protein AAF385_13010, partial [Pseudomonadota bacterium]
KVSGKKKVAKKAAKKKSVATKKRKVSKKKVAAGRKKAKRKTVRKKATKKKVAKKKKAKKKATKKTVKKATKKTVKKKTKKKAASKANLAVEIACDHGEVLNLPVGKELQTLAMRWRYVLSRRLRWKHSSKKQMREAAAEAIRGLAGVTDMRQSLGKASVIEIQVPFVDEQTAWEGRVAPWEFLLSAAAGTAGNKNPMAIVRWLKTAHRAPVLPSQPHVLYVECAPGVLAGTYDFSSERAALEGLFKNSVDVCINPTIDELREAVQKFRPHIIHIAGIDNNQAKELLQDQGDLPASWPDSKSQDGIVFESDKAHHELELEPIDAEQLARVLNSGPEELCLVTANVYHSASRICALAVAEGAGLALGFQDTVSDSLAEILLRDFYSNWTQSHEPLTAFVGALDVARASVSLSGTGVVLWSADTLLDGAVDSVIKTRKSRKDRRKQDLQLDSSYPEWFDVDISVRERLNYSLLHNDSGGLFEVLSFRKEKPGVLRDVNVEVVLYLGSESHPYSASFTLTEYLTKVDDKVKVPLTSSMIRTVQEPVRTSLYVKVSVGGKVVREETHRVTLLPAYEWRDSDADRIWLPSFVLPRDPAIEPIIERAQKHLVTLSDDHRRGFDGYQSIDPDDPESLAEIDMQVQAIWAAIVSDFGIRYINPPPSYTRLGQRLRTPTQIVRGGRGTCIDLALLLSACLEYIEIYPVVFLLEGHAFAGYWRSEDRYYSFNEAFQEGIEEDTMRASIGTSDSQAAWILPSDSYAEILNEVNSGFLYPIETVGFTTHGSFWEAIEEGVDNLRSRSEFHSLIDIWLARSEFITPLPIVDDIIDLRRD